MLRGALHESTGDIVRLVPVLCRYAWRCKDRLLLEPCPCACFPPQGQAAYHSGQMEHPVLTSRGPLLTNGLWTTGCRCRGRPADIARPPVHKEPSMRLRLAKRPRQQLFRRLLSSRPLCTMFLECVKSPLLCLHFQQLQGR